MAMRALTNRLLAWTDRWQMGQIQVLHTLRCRGWLFIVDSRQTVRLGLVTLAPFMTAPMFVLLFAASRWRLQANHLLARIHFAAL